MQWLVVGQLSFWSRVGCHARCRLAVGLSWLIVMMIIILLVLLINIDQSDQLSFFER